MTGGTIITILTFALLVVGVLGSLWPRVPGAALSLAGVFLYWWGSGFTEPEVTTVALLTLVAIAALAGQVFGTVVSARIGGASSLSATIAGVVGFAGFLFMGTTGLLVGTVVTVFVLEYVRRREVKGSLAAALVVVLGTFASKLIQFLLTGAMLVVMVAVVLF